LVNIILGGPGLDQPADVEKGGAVGHPGRLLHVVGDDDDGVAAQFVDQLLDLLGGHRIEGRARLVHQQDLGGHGQRAGDAQPLLLAAGEPQGAFAKAVLDLFPQGGLPQALFDPLLDGVAVPQNPLTRRP
jgi:hypothetical protein